LIFSRRAVEAGSGRGQRPPEKRSGAFRMQRALVLLQRKTGILHHSDRGSQYCSYDYQRVLGRHGFILSMSGKGNCYDCESVGALGGPDPCYD